MATDTLELIELIELSELRALAQIVLALAAGLLFIFLSGCVGPRGQNPGPCRWFHAYRFTSNSLH